MRPCQFLTAAALALALTGCEPIEDGSGGFLSDARVTPDVQTTDTRADEASAPWSPSVTTASDTQVGTSAATLLSFFGGEVKIQLQEGSLDADTTITLTRAVVTVGGQDWVGYTFGDHGIPLDPRAELTVVAPLDWLPPGAALDPTLGLYRVDGVRLGAKLSTAPAEASDSRVTIIASLDALDTFVLATNSSGGN